ncbi:MAG: EI24 domain-containing protein [Alphaproteobacteria bacterium]|nr:EI24 domain-containing protein [Alphaproteobacteria bacterium]
MIKCLMQSFHDVLSKPMRPLLLISLALTLFVLVGLLFGFWQASNVLLDFEQAWINNTIKAFGFLFFILCAIMTFPSIMMFIASFFLDSAIERLSKGMNLKLVPMKESLKMSGILCSQSILATMLVSPLAFGLGFIPFLNFVPIIMYYSVNGYLLGKEYFISTASRYVGMEDAKALFEKDKKYWQTAGAIIALMMTIPVINTIAPLVGIAFIKRLWDEKKYNIYDNGKVIDIDLTEKSENNMTKIITIIICILGFSTLSSCAINTELPVVERDETQEDSQQESRRKDPVLYKKYVIKKLGNPTVVRKENPSEMLVYSHPTCNLFIYINEKEIVKHIEIGNPDYEKVEKDSMPCLKSANKLR